VRKEKNLRFLSRLGGETKSNRKEAKGAKVTAYHFQNSYAIGREKRPRIRKRINEWKGIRSFVVRHR